LPPIRQRLRAAAIFLLSLGIFASCRPGSYYSTIPPSYRMGHRNVTVMVPPSPVDGARRACDASRGRGRAVPALARVAGRPGPAVRCRRRPSGRLGHGRAVEKGYWLPARCAPNHQERLPASRLSPDTVPDVIHQRAQRSRGQRSPLFPCAFSPECHPAG
jgi:hypothetical protein